MKRYGFEEQSAVLFGGRVADGNFKRLEGHGASTERILNWLEEADAVWNLCNALEPALHKLSRRSALLDADPGMLQIPAMNLELNIEQYDVFFTTGTKINDEDCKIPRLNLEWVPFVQPVYLPDWEVDQKVSKSSPITSVTQWNWPAEFWLEGKCYSDSKRDAYLAYLGLPKRTGSAFRLAANIDPQDDTGDADLLTANGWHLVHLCKHPVRAACQGQAARAVPRQHLWRRFKVVI